MGHPTTRPPRHSASAPNPFKRRPEYIPPAQRRIPPICPTVELVAWSVPVASWPVWKRLRGGGFRSWCRWVWTQGYVTEDELRRIQHADWVVARVCHVAAGRRYCFCGGCGRTA